jgi:hypothetical protein
MGRFLPVSAERLRGFGSACNRTEECRAALVLTNGNIQHGYLNPAANNQRAARPVAKDVS